MPHLAGAAHRDRAALEPAAHPACAAAGPFEECLKAYSDVNEINTPSYMGGTLIQKKGEKKSAVGAGIWSDRLAVQAENQRAHVQYGVEMVKAARSRPIAYGNLGIIAMMRHGRP